MPILSGIVQTLSKIVPILSGAVSPLSQIVQTWLGMKPPLSEIGQYLSGIVPDLSGTEPIISRKVPVMSETGSRIVTTLSVNLSGVNSVFADFLANSPLTIMIWRVLIFVFHEGKYLLMLLTPFLLSRL